jgi:hypothetical protein
MANTSEHNGMRTWVAQALERLHLSGLLLLALLHLPMVVLMGFAWRLASGDDPPASPSTFVWARFVRDGAGEVLPGAADPLHPSALPGLGCSGMFPPPTAAMAASLVRRARDLVLGVGTLGIAAVGDAGSALLRLRY